MSVVIAVKQGGRIWFGADTQLTSGSDRYNYLSEGDYKVAKLDNGILLSWTGETAVWQTILGHLDWFTLNGKGELTKEHIVTKILPNLYGGLKEEDALERGDEGIPLMMTGRMTLACKDKLFEICRDFQVMRYEDYQATGSGAHAVLYGLSKMDKTQDINAQLLELLRISAKHDTAVSAPFIFIDTQDLQYTVKED